MVTFICPKCRRPAVSFDRERRRMACSWRDCRWTSDDRHWGQARLAYDDDFSPLGDEERRRRGLYVPLRLYPYDSPPASAGSSPPR